MLGPGSYSAFITTRGGRETVAELPWTSLRWGRLVDEVSSASLELTGTAFECFGQTRGIHPYMHELSILRSGERAWSGPIVAKSWRAGPQNDGMTISARDLMQWTRRRRIHSDHNYTNIDLAVMFNSVIRDAMSVDNSPRLRVAAPPCGVLGSRRWLAAQYRTAYDVLRELADTELDWTVIDRTVMAHGVEINLPPLPTLTDQAFIDFEEVIEDGVDLTTDQVVTGAGVGEAGATIVGRHTVDTAELYGVHESTYNSGDIRDTTTAIRLARSRALLNQHPVIGFNGGSLSGEAPVTIADLVPGRVVPVSIETIGIYGAYRLVSVEGSVGPEHERVSISVEPVGATSQRALEWAAARQASG